MTVSPIQTKLRTADVKGYPRSVIKVIREAVNEHGVAYRVLDGTHIRLYCGDRDVVPFKISGHSRPEQETLDNLLSWLEINVASWADRDRELTDEDVVELALTVNTQGRALGVPPRVTKVETVRVGTADQAVGKYPNRERKPRSVETQRAMAVASTRPLGRPLDEHPDQWVAYVSPKGPSYGFETDGSTYRCKTCGHEQSTARGLHLHEGKHTGAASENSRKAYASRVTEEAATEPPTRPVDEVAAELRAEQLKTHLTAAARVLAEHFGVGADVAQYEAEIKALNAELLRTAVELEGAQERLAATTKERDDLTAKLDLMREAMGM